MIQLPVTKNGNSRLTVPIDGVLYTLKYRYNTRNKRLFLSIFIDSVPVVVGLRLIEKGQPIINYSIPELPESQLYVLEDLEGTGFATLGNLGIDKEYNLLFYKESEQAEEELRHSLEA